MIRNVVLGRVRPGSSPEDLEEALDAIMALKADGLIEMRVGVDAGLREGNWSYAITADFVDGESYRRYDLDEEHNRVRREMFAPLSEEIARVQFET